MRILANTIKAATVAIALGFTTSIVLGAKAGYFVWDEVVKLIVKVYNESPNLFPYFFIASVLAGSISIAYLVYILFPVFKKVNLHTISVSLPFIRGIWHVNPNPSIRGDSEIGYNGTPYIIKQSVWFIDFSNHNFSNLEADNIVTVERVDTIRKCTEENINYSLPFFTFGENIICEYLSYPIEPSFKRRNVPNEKGMTAYDYILPIGVQPKNFTSRIINKFTFYNAFQEPDSEWWAASVKYYTECATVIFHFKEEKKCKTISAKLQTGHSDVDVSSSGTELLKLQDGRFVYWVGNDIPADSRIYFSFTW